MSEKGLIVIKGELSKQRHCIVSEKGVIVIKGGLSKTRHCIVSDKGLTVIKGKPNRRKKFDSGSSPRLRQGFFLPESTSGAGSFAMSVTNSTVRVGCTRYGN